jgi:hypothetical protein
MRQTQQQRQRERTQAGTDLDKAISGLWAHRMHDLLGHGGILEEILAKALARLMHVPPVLAEELRAKSA